MDNLKTIKKVANMMQKCGISHFKCADFELSVDLHFEKPIKNRSKSIQITESKEQFIEQYSDMDALLWSAPGLELPEDK